MKNNNFQKARDQYNERKDEVLESRLELYHLRSDFVKYFNRNKISNMELEDYVVGLTGRENRMNFCYGLERQLEKLGRINGATAFKFGVYYGRTRTEGNCKYRFAKKFGNSYQEAFENVRNAILDLLNDDKRENIDKIVSNRLSPMFKGKILSTYYPEKYLNIFSNDHLTYYLTHLNLATVSLIKSDPVYKREALIAFKNQDLIMKNWPVDLFSVFLWSEYPGHPPRYSENVKIIKESLS
jgi:hypothetical protein